MTIKHFAMPLLLASLSAFAADSQPADTLNATTAFSRLKSLVGEWYGDGPMGQVRVNYSLIAGGTALLEREQFGKMPEMATVYHMDGKRLLLTHYCAAGNQPRMEATSFDPTTGEVKFRFLDATNLANPASGHMKNATLRFVDSQRFQADWEFYEGGQLKKTERVELTRVR